MILIDLFSVYLQNKLVLLGFPFMLQIFFDTRSITLACTQVFQIIFYVSLYGIPDMIDFK